MLFKVEGIVIRSSDYGEGHKIINIYTPTHGKISLMARGAKKVRSRHGASSQLFTHGEFTFFKGSGMGTLNYCEVTHAFQSLRSDLQYAAYASYLAELTDKALDESDASAYVYNQLLAGMTALEAGKDALIIATIFELIVLRTAGYQPELRRCVTCGTDTDLQGFDPQSGGLLCARCGTSGSATAFILSEKSLRLLRILAETDLTRLGNVAVSEESRAQLKMAVRGLIRLQLPVNLKSRHFLDQMDRMPFG